MYFMSFLYHWLVSRHLFLSPLLTAKYFLILFCCDLFVNVFFHSFHVYPFPPYLSALPFSSVSPIDCHSDLSHQNFEQEVLTYSNEQQTIRRLGERERERGPQPKNYVPPVSSYNIHSVNIIWYSSSRPIAS